MGNTPRILKKALSKTFNTRKPRQTLVLGVFLAAAAAGGTEMAMTETPSATRTPVLGEQQYNRLKKDLDTMVALKPEIAAADKAAAALQQQVLADPENYALESRLWKAREQRTEIKYSLEAQTYRFKENLLASEGISEQDAIALVSAFEQKIDTETFRPYESGNRLAYLDECQAASKSQENPYNVPWCVIDSSELPGKPFAMLGAGFLAAALAFGLAGAGARLEKELKAEGDAPVPKKDKKKKFTINILND